MGENALYRHIFNGRFFKIDFFGSSGKSIFFPVRAVATAGESSEARDDRCVAQVEAFLISTK